MSKLELNRDMYLAAAAERMTFSQYLEKIDPSPKGSPYDAFERQLIEHGLYPKSDYEKGIHASTVQAFYTTSDSQVLFPEFVARQVRDAVVQDTVLPYLIGQNTVITGDTYRTFYVDDQPEASRKKRVTENSELPRATIVGKEQVVKLYKFGRAIEASYEVIRRMQIDMLSLHVRRIAIQTAKDKVEEILTVIADGDGNSNPAPVLDLTDLDTAATAGTLTPAGLLAFLMEFEPYPCNTLVASKDAFIQLMLGSVPTLTTGDLVRLLTQGTTLGITLSAPQLPGGQFRAFWNDNVPSLEIYGINGQFAIEQVTEAGSDISEADKFITRQTSILTVSENSGYSKILNEATKILDINA